jgi:hypothetical protein
VAALALVVLYFGISFVLSRFLDPQALAGWLEPRLEEALNRDVEVGRVEVGFMPLGVELHEITVADPTGLAPELARVRSLDLRVAVLPLIRRKVQVNRLAVDGLRANLRVSEDGLSNFGDLSTRTTGTGESAEAPQEETPPPIQDTTGMEAGTDTAPSPTEQRQPFTLDLRGLRLLDGEIAYSDEASTLQGRVRELRLRASARRDDSGGWLLVGSTGGSATLRQGGAAPVLEDVPLELSFDVAMDGEMEQLRVRTGDLRLDQLVLALTGEVNHLQDPVRVVSLDIRGSDLPFPHLLALLPDSLRNQIPVQAQGRVAARFRVEGEAGPHRLPIVTGRADLTQGEITLDGNGLAQRLTAGLELRADRSVHLQADGVVLDGPFSVEGLGAFQDGPRVDAVLRVAPELARATDLMELPDGVTTQGRLPSEVRIAGPLGHLSDLRFRGNVGFEQIQATHPSLAAPVAVPRGDMELNGIRAIFEDLPIELGDDRIFLSGEVVDLLAFLDADATPRFQGTIRGPRMDLPRLSARPRPDSTLTYGKVAFAKVGGRQIQGRSIQEAAEDLGLVRPDSLPLSGRLILTLDTVIDTQGRMEDLRARLEFGPDFLLVSDASFRRYGGEIRTNADLNLSGSREAPFSANLRVQGLDAGDFLSQTTPLGRFVRGTLDLEVDLVGTLDGLLLPEGPSLVGSATFSLTGGGLNSTPLTRSVAQFLGVETLREPSIRDWAGSLVLENGRIRLSESTLEGAPGSPEVGGTIGLDGGLDLRSVFDLPLERLNTSALEQMGFAGEILADVARRPDVVQAVLNIGGSVLDPSVEADPASAARTLGQAVEEEVRSQVQEEVEAQKAEARRRIQEQKEELRNRATGFLRSLIRPPDTTTPPPPPDSGVAVPPADTFPPDTLTPDTLTPDTVLPDTLRPDTVPPDTAPPDTLQPDTLPPDTLQPDTLQPDTLPPDTLQPDTLRPDTLRPDTLQPDTLRPDTVPPEARSAPPTSALRKADEILARRVCRSPE